MNKRVQKGHYRATPWPGFRRFRGFGLPLAGWFKGWRWRLTPQIIKKPARAPVISTEAKRSGEISPSDGTGGITVGDFSAQSIMGAVPICLP